MCCVKTQKANVVQYDVGLCHFGYAALLIDFGVMAPGLALVVLQEQERQRQVEAHNQQLRQQQQLREQQQHAEHQREDQKRAQQQREQQQREQQEREQQQREQQQLQQQQVLLVHPPMHAGHKSLHAQCLHLLISHARKLPFLPSATDPGHKLLTVPKLVLLCRCILHTLQLLVKTGL